MPCYHVDLPDGGHAIVRSNLGPHCSRCRRVGEFLCDFPVGGGRTCDRPVCKAHRHPVAPGVDYCTVHAVNAPRWVGQLELFSWPRTPAEAGPVVSGADRTTGGWIGEP